MENNQNHTCSHAFIWKFHACRETSSKRKRALKESPSGLPSIEYFFRKAKEMIHFKDGAVIQYCSAGKFSKDLILI